MNQTHPLVSVLMTAYNREKYIAEAIESVLASTYTHWELIIVDDCSTDKTVEIAKNYKLKDERINIHINERNLGDYPNRNKAASFARGKYLKYLDSDDVLYPHSLSIMVEAMEEFPWAALGISYSRINDDKPYPINLSPREAYIEHFINRGVLNCGPSGAIILKDAFEKEKGFSGERYLGDADLWLRFAAKYDTVKIQPALVWWRKHEGQEFILGMESGHYQKKAFIFNLKMINDKNCPLEPELKEKAIKKQKQHHARRILSFAFKKGDFKMAWHMYRQSELCFIDLLRGFRSYL